MPGAVGGVYDENRGTRQGEEGQVRKKKWQKAFPGIYVENRVFESAAFQSLNASAIKVLLRFLSKREVREADSSGRRTGRVITNNGEITFPYTEAWKMGLTRATFSSALKTLVKAGFISVTRGGGLAQGGAPLPSKFAVNVVQGQPHAAWEKYKPAPRKRAASRPENLKNHPVDR